MHEFEVEVNNEIFSFTVITNTIYLRSDKRHIEIPFSSLSSIYVKDCLERHLFSFLLKVQAKEIYVIGFANSNIRDFFKGYFTYLIKEKVSANIVTEDIIKTYSIKDEENEQSSVKIIKNIQMKRDGIKCIETSKSSFMEFLVSRPVLLVILGELNCTLTQFYNYFKQSYFYDIKNQKNVVDRMLNEKTREYTLANDGFATRINTHSFLEVNKEETIKDGNKQFSEDEVDFIPIYPESDVGERKIVSDFQFSNNLEIRFEAECVAEDFVPADIYDKGVLNQLLVLCKEAFNSKKENVEERKAIIQRSMKYSELLKKDDLQSFDPKKYFQN